MAVGTDELPEIPNYEPIEKIAEGGMGSVYKYRQRSSGQMVAIKVVPPSMASNPVLLKRFEQEFRASRLLDHPNIVKALEFGTAGTCPYLVMEFVEGETLGQKLDREKRLPEAEAIRLIAQVAQGLHRAHKQGLIHRDVKPDNVLIRARRPGQAYGPGAGQGSGRRLEPDPDRPRRLGTPHFMASERFLHAKNADDFMKPFALSPRSLVRMMVSGELRSGRAHRSTRG